MEKCPFQPQRTLAYFSRIGPGALSDRSRKMVPLSNSVEVTLKNLGDPIVFDYQILVLIKVVNLSNI